MVHVLPTAESLGGTEQAVLDLAISRELDDLDQRLLFLTAKGISTIPPEADTSSLDPRALGPLRAILRLARTRPAIAHGWLFRGNIIVCLAKLLRPRMVVVTSERNLGHAMTPLKRLVERVVTMLEDVATANSKAVRDAAVARAPHRAARFRILSPGLGPVAPPELVEQVACVMVGRLHPVKDHDTALETWLRVTRVHPDATLAILGDGPEHGRLQRRIEELQLESSVRLVGHRSPWPYLYGARVFLSTSLAEGFSRATLEALAVGLPVVTTDVGGARLLPEQAARLARVRDDKRLAEHIVALLGDPAARKRAGKAGKEAASETFSLERCHADYRALYAALELA